MPKKAASVEAEIFGRRLARLRKEAGYTQQTLGAEVGISQRMMAYYEVQTSHPPAHLLPALADALGLSVDELLGRRRRAKSQAPSNQRLMRQLQKVEKLPSHARRAVLEHIDGLVAKYGTGD
jgi:transcriptional regulator with XRE-family HTH domain